MEESKPQSKPIRHKHRKLKSAVGLSVQNDIEPSVCKSSLINKRCLSLI